MPLPATWAGGVTPADEPWWKAGVLYQIYPRSFADSNADGVGDIPGIIEHLDHLAWLGVDGIWLSPVTVSPNADWGYDVSDFCAIAPEFGTLRRLRPAGRRGRGAGHPRPHGHRAQPHQRAAPVVRRLRARRARRPTGTGTSGPTARRTGQPPNNWVSSFGGPGWTLDEATGQYYFHNHLAGAARPQLVERGRAGHVRRHLPLLVRPGRRRVPHRRLQRHHQGRRAPRQPAGHRGRRLRDADVRAAQRLQRQPARGARGDQALAPPGRRLRRAPAPDRRDPGPGGQAGRVLRRRDRRARAGLQLQLHQRALPGPGDARPSSRRPRRRCRPGPGRRGRAPTTTCSAFPPAGPRTTRPRSAWPCSCCCACAAPRSSTRATRSAWRTSRWPRRTCATRSACASTRTTRGATPAARRCSGATGRAAGFTDADRPWLPLGDLAAANVAAQRDDPGSVLTLCRDLIAFRASPSGVQLRGTPRRWRRPRTSGRGRGGSAMWWRSTCPRRSVVLPGLPGTIQLGTDRARELEVVRGALDMAAFEGLILERPL